MITIVTTIKSTEDGNDIIIDHKPSGLDTATDLEKEFGKMYYVARMAVETAARKAADANSLSITRDHIEKAVKDIVDEGKDTPTHTLKPWIDATKRAGWGPRDKPE